MSDWLSGCIGSRKLNVRVVVLVICGLICRSTVFSNSWMSAATAAMKKPSFCYSYWLFLIEKLPEADYVQHVAQWDTLILCEQTTSMQRCATQLYHASNQVKDIHFHAGLEMATDTVNNATKMVPLPTRSFQAVAKLATSSKLMTQLIKDAGRIRLQLKLVNWRLSFLFLLFLSSLISSAVQ